jgi:hypothetical protein
LTLPRIFFTRGGSEFAAYPFPSNRLGSSLPYTAFFSAAWSDELVIVINIIMTLGWGVQEGPPGGATTGLLSRMSIRTPVWLDR